MARPKGSKNKSKIEIQLFTNVCIKPGCGITYQSDDPDPYYCPQHEKEAKAIAETINKKLAGAASSRKVQTDLSIIEEKGMNYRGMRAVRASDLGL